MAIYQEITSLAALDEFWQASHQQPVLFFKHSNTCPISSRALGEFEKYLADAPDAATRHALIVVQTARAVSDKLAALTGVQHESPQAILVRAGQSVWDESHLQLKRAVLVAAVQAAQPETARFHAD